MHLREIAVFADDALVENYQGGFVQRFHRESLCVTESFQLAFGRPLAGNVDKVQITACALGRVEKTDPPVDLWLTFDFAHYAQALSGVRKAMLGELVRRGLDAVVEQAGWQASDIAAEHAKAAEQSYVVRRRVGKRWLSQSPAPHRSRCGLGYRHGQVRSGCFAAKW